MWAMLKGLSIRSRMRGIVLIFIGSIVLTSAIDVVMLRAALQHEKENTIRQLVDGAFGILSHFEKQERNGNLSRSTAQAAAKAALRDLRYNGKDYFWINENRRPARMVMHPIFPELEGQQLVGERFNCVTGLRSGTAGPFTATDGKTNLTDAFADVVAPAGQGYVAYQWPKQNAGGGSTERTYPKLSFVREFAPWGWIVGSGIYVDDIDAVVHQRVSQSLIVIVGVGAALLLIASLIARSITRPLANTMRAMDDVAHGNAGLDHRLAGEGPIEVVALARHFNAMLDHIEAGEQALRRHQEGLEIEVASRTASLRHANQQLDTELTERRRIEAVINQAKLRMRALLDATNESVVLCSPAGEILEINAAAARRYGHTPQQMAGTNLMDYQPPELAASRRQMIDVVVRTRQTVRFTDRRGGITFDVTGYPVVGADGRVESIAAYAKDVTEQRRREQEESLFQELASQLIHGVVDIDGQADAFSNGLCSIFDLPAAAVALADRGNNLRLLGNATDQVWPIASGLHGAGEDREADHAIVTTPDVKGEILVLPLLIHQARRGVLLLQGEKAGQFADESLRQHLLAVAERFAFILESALRQERLALFDLALAEVGNAVMITDPQGQIVWVNRALTALSGYAADDLIGQTPRLFASGQHDADFYRTLWQTIGAGHTWRGDIVNRRCDGSLYTATQTITPLFRGDNQIVHFVSILDDISQRKRQEQALQDNLENVRALNEQLENAQNQLLASEKMASIGQLAAGVAHEINNPIGFVRSNLGSLKTYADELLVLIDTYGEGDHLLAGDPVLARRIAEQKKQADLAFIRQDIASLVDESRDGIDRIGRIVQALKDFSRIDSVAWALANLEQGLDSTLDILSNEIGGKADIVRQYAGIPQVECLGSQLNQVFMNLLRNAVQSIDGRGLITLRTGRDGDDVWIEITDTGKGIAPENLPRVFDPFFTTRPVGQGTGLGLSQAYSIVQKHHGRLTVSSEPGQGSCFRLEIPIRQPNTT